MNYEILDIDALGRIGKIYLNNKEMITPNIFPVVHPYKNIISPSEIKDLGAEGIITNSYILYQNEKYKTQVLNKGLHSFLNYDGLIATDSGAFQQYMYNDNKIDINAAEIEYFQEEIQSDFPVILDIPVQLDDDYETAKKKVAITLQRAKENIERRKNGECAWFGPIHGAKHLNLVEYSAKEMNKLEFEVYAIGGLVKAFLDYRFDITIKILLRAKKYLNPNKPIHMFGLGLPPFFSLAVASGCDLMDSAAYILFAKEKRYFTLSTGTKKLEELKEFPCHCRVCTQYTPTEIKQLNENKQIKLLAKHNLYLSFSELRTIRQAIREGNLWELVEQRIRNHPSLVGAADLLYRESLFIEQFEKCYKSHGRLFSSFESLQRPIIQRYIYKIKSNYKIPEGVKYLIILPELDVRGESSQSVKEWIDLINNNTILQSSYIHIAIFSPIFGIIPLELSETFPLAQYEFSIALLEQIKKHSMKLLQNFFETHKRFYKKCAIMIPEYFINQFNEQTEFKESHPINLIKSYLEQQIKIKCAEFKQIDEILKFFKID